MDTRREITRSRAVPVRCLILVCAVVGMYAGGPVGSAHGANYLVEECHTDATAAAAPDAVPVSTPRFGPGDACPPANNGLAIAGTGIANGLAGYREQGGWVFNAPAGTVFRNINFEARLTGCSYGNVPYIQAGVSGQSGYQVLLQADCSTPGINYYPVPCVSQTVDRWGCRESPGGAGFASNYLVLLDYCDVVSPGCFANPDEGGAFRQFEFLLEDTARPNTPGLAGSLVEGGPRRGSESLVVNASDAGSGVQAIDIYVNGTRVPQSTTVPCDVGGGFARRFTPCPPAYSYSSVLNTEQAPWQAGDNALKVCSTDLSFQSQAGNVSLCAQSTVNVDNSCTDSPGANTGTTLDAGALDANGGLQLSAAVTSNDQIRLAGTLRGASGPVGGANVCVYEQVDSPGQPKLLVNVVQTNGGGSFTSRLDAGPSRTVYVDYRHSNLLVRKQLKIDSMVIPVLKIKKHKLHNGKKMRFSGTIPGPADGHRGVTIQAKVGKKWRTFQQVTTDDNGLFKGAYRFKHSTLARATYKFRALVKAQAGYPYRSGHSAKQKVVVYG